MMWSRRKILVAVMVFYGLVMISPVFPYLGISGTFVTIALFAALFVVFGGAEIRLSNWFPFVVLTILILACVPAIFWMDARYVLATIFLIFSLFSCSGSTLGRWSGSLRLRQRSCWFC